MSRIAAFYTLLLLYTESIICLEGNNQAICYKSVRITRPIDLGDDTYDDTRWEKVAHCCDGYEEENDECKPICSASCIQGDCVAPETCQCYEGFEGDDCSTLRGECVDGRFGKDCDKTCQCNGSPCDRSTGVCECKDGFTGAACEIPCPEGKFGRNCEQQCSCEEGLCNFENGKCTCKPGYAGENCSEVCPRGFFGQNCQEPCPCQNGARCDHVTGACTCAAGFQGPACSMKCPPGKWGAGCVHSCECKDSCDAVTGDCQCEPGYHGKQCELTCDEGLHGRNCSETCSCLNGDCSHVDGTCDCHQGWIGRNCGQKNCTDWSFGLNCDGECGCVRNNTKFCDIYSGECICKDGWTGNSCEQPCTDGFYGENCSKECSCVEGHYESCDKVTGHCFCKREWKGQWCGVPCDCQNGGECDPNGRCNCTAGWSGQNCNEACKPGSYGENCSKICYYYGLDTFRCDRFVGDVCAEPYEGPGCENCPCEPNGECNTTTGTCTCKPGYFGLHCKQTCPKGRYGQNCTMKCQCEDCRPTDGHCKCQPDWNSTLCTDYCSIEMFDTETKRCRLSSESATADDNSAIFLGAGLSLAILLLVIGIVLFVWRCKFTTSTPVTLRENSPKFYRTDEDRSSRMTNTYEREEPKYEVIPEGPIVPYDRLHAHFPRRYNDPLYFSYGQYEVPTHVLNSKEEYVALNTLDIPERDRRDFVGPIPIDQDYPALLKTDRRSQNHAGQHSPYAAPSTFHRWK